ncbi:MAG: radical SAM protein [Gemmatimonadaceae bacterium]|nr:radical SAM protein [Gemmatimonadaceae bacterium]
MRFRASMRAWLVPALKKRPRVWSMVRKTDLAVERTRHSAARMLPVLIRPQPRQLHVAITAHCNQRCAGCRYGREFMQGHQLSLQMVRHLIDDAADAGFGEVRLYGGEPLLHPDLPAMVAHVIARGMRPYVTTNAVLLRHRIDALYEAGLRNMNIGFYGVGDAYDSYVHRHRSFDRVEAGIKAVRDRYGMDVNMRINWLLMRPSATLADLDAACRFADRYQLRIQVDLVHYSLPYFTEGPEGALQFRPEDRPQLECITADLLRRQREQPDLFVHADLGLRAIPDWIMNGAGMRVPCDAGNMAWVGADGTVQLCYVTFRLGNLHEQRLSAMLFNATHRQAARDAFTLDCPNCHCGYDTRVLKDATAARRYRDLLDAEAVARAG